jgi:carnitine O-acetyltransferase
MHSFLNAINCCLVETAPEENTNQESLGGSNNMRTKPPPTTTATTSTALNGSTSTSTQSRPEISTFQNQESLPRLPIPSLPSTLSRFIEAVEPLLTETQLQKTKSIVDTFLEKNGHGPTLQSLLLQYDSKAARDGTFGSYIEEFWNDAYLVPDTSVVLNLNPYFLLEEDADAKIAKDQIKRASVLVFNSLMFAASLKNETMTPDVVKGTKLCMDQFKSLFGSCRIPKLGESDVVQVDQDSSHVVVLFRNQFYYFTGLWPKSSNDGKVKVAVNEADIAEILRTIVDDAKKVSKSASVRNAFGVLTTLPRNAWAKARDQFVQLSVSNKKDLSIIESALFILALDEFSPTDVHEAAANMLHGTHFMVPSEEGDISTSFSKRYILPSLAYQGGTCGNRFYDKLQIIVCEDGSAGINFEHSAIDGHTALRFVSDVFAQTIVTFAKSITKSIYTKTCPIPSIINAEVVRALLENRGKEKTDRTYFDTSPKKLMFDIDEKISDQIFFAETRLGDAVNGDDTFILEFKSFGKNLIVHNSMR